MDHRPPRWCSPTTPWKSVSASAWPQPRTCAPPISASSRCGTAQLPASGDRAHRRPSGAPAHPGIQGIAPLVAQPSPLVEVPPGGGQRKPYATSGNGRCGRRRCHTHARRRRRDRRLSPIARRSVGTGPTSSMYRKNRSSNSPTRCSASMRTNMKQPERLGINRGALRSTSSSR